MWRHSLGFAALLVGLSAAPAAAGRSAADPGVAITPVAVAALEAAIGRRDLLTKSAEGGDPTQQLALSLAFEHGLGGARDPAQAEVWRARALAVPRRGRTMTTWRAGVNGEPGRVVTLAISRRPVGKLDVFFARSCAGLFVASGPEAAADADRLCGPEAERLRALWGQAAGAEARSGS